MRVGSFLEPAPLAFEKKPQNWLEGRVGLATTLVQEAATVVKYDNFDVQTATPAPIYVFIKPAKTISCQNPSKPVAALHETRPRATEAERSRVAGHPK